MAAVVVLVALPPDVERFRLAHVPSARLGMPAHVTLLYPFPDETFGDATALEAIDAIAASAEPFAFRLPTPGRWPASVHVQAEPAGPFVSIVDALVRAFPDSPPYRGAHPVVPHVSLAEDGTDPTVDDPTVDLDRLASMAFRADSIVLIGHRPGADPDGPLETLEFPLRGGQALSGTQRFVRKVRRS